MADLDTPRTPPQLDDVPPELKVSLSSDFDPQAMPILDTYSPFPTFGARDPFGLDAFLLHPHDASWDYLQPSSIPGEDLPESERPKHTRRSALLRQSSAMLRQSSPLSAPPLISDDDDDNHCHEAGQDLPRTRRPVSIGTKGLLALVGRKSNATASPDTPEFSVPTTPDEDEELTSRPTSMASLVSSGSSEGSCDGVKTPCETPGPLDVSARLLTAALQDDQRKASRSSWRGWLDSKRTSFLGMRGGEAGTTLLESPRASVVDLAAEVPDAESSVIGVDTDAARSAAALRRVSLIKLGSLRMPSAHPLAAVLARQLGDLPNEVAFSIPATKRVYPMSVNLWKNTTELAPAQGGLRVALGLRNIIHKIDVGERPRELRMSRRAPQQNAMQRARGIRDFVARKPFEERMVVYLADETCSEVSTARPGYAIWDVDFTDYIQALAEAEEMPPALCASATSHARTAGPPPPRRQPVLRVVNPTQDKDVSAAVSPAPAAAAALPQSSFRNARRRPQTWDDSSDDEDDEEPKSDDDMVAKSVPLPSRPATKRTTTAPARIRESKVMDASAALDMLTRARERRGEFNSGEVERRAGAEERRKSMMMPTAVADKRASTSPVKPTVERRMPSRRMSTMTLATHQVRDRTERPAISHRASSYSLATPRAGQQTPPKSLRPPTSLPPSPRLRPDLDRRRVVSTHEQPRALVYQPTGMYPHTPAYPPRHMMLPPQATSYLAQFPHASPSMYFHPPPPATGRRRERPVA